MSAGGIVIVIITLSLCRRMNDVSHTKNACTSCGHAETPPTGTHNECDTQVTVIQNITPSSSKNQSQMPEHPTSV